MAKGSVLQLECGQLEALGPLKEPVSCAWSWTLQLSIYWKSWEFVPGGLLGYSRTKQIVASF